MLVGTDVQGEGLCGFVGCGIEFCGFGGEADFAGRGGEVLVVDFGVLADVVLVSEFGNGISGNARFGL